MIIQIILIVIIALIVARQIIRFKKREIKPIQFTGWLIVWLAAAAAVIWPDITVRVANYVGVGRGSDLVIYLALIFIFYMIFRLLVRIEKMEKNLTEVVRTEALKEYDKHE